MNSSKGFSVPVHAKAATYYVDGSGEHALTITTD